MKTFKILSLAAIFIASLLVISCSSEKKPEVQPEVKQDSVAVEEPVKSEEPTVAPTPIKKKVQQVEEESVPPTVYLMPKERSAGEIGRLISNHDSEMKELLNSYKAKDPSLSGTIVIVATVAADGKVVTVASKNSTITDKSLERALITRVRLWKFSEIDPKVGNQTYDVPYGFSR